MLRRLIVLRHAKSDWDTEAPTDHDRPLNKRGRRDAPRVADALANSGWTPKRVVSSDAQRTRETWKRMKRSFDRDIKVKFTTKLYHAGIHAVREVVSNVPESVDVLMLIGHNPGWESVVDALTGEDVRLSTCDAALLSIDAESWADAIAADGGWRVHRVLRPKELKEDHKRKRKRKDDSKAKDKRKDGAAGKGQAAKEKGDKDKGDKRAKSDAAKDKPIRRPLPSMARGPRPALTSMARGPRAPLPSMARDPRAPSGQTQNKRARKKTAAQRRGKPAAANVADAASVDHDVMTSFRDSAGIDEQPGAELGNDKADGATSSAASNGS